MRPSTVSSHLPVRAAAASTLGAAVGADVAAGADATHVGALAVLALLISGLRLRLAGRYRLLFALLSGGVVAQPALHLAVQAALVSGPHPGTGADWSTVVAHLTVAVGLAVIVGSVEFQVARLEGLVDRVVRLLRARGRWTPAVSGTPPHPASSRTAVPSWEQIGSFARRGPPPRAVALAAP